MQDKVLSLLSLATKAGKTASGEFMVENEVKSGKASLVILATDCSDNTKKKFRDMCAYRDTNIVEYSEKEELGRCIGKEFRACVAVSDEGFAAGILKQLDNFNV
ncbi:MAG: ribosomal L7Ae/L30e/S12e/Gadd45 family protein [Lachnospiraceae bacterium]|nr:ribosomal L7Ae/L30e/S12e/Gadd45 family protein [Lachnospiraceae bacterium]